MIFLPLIPNLKYHNLHIFLRENHVRRALGGVNQS